MKSQFVRKAISTDLDKEIAKMHDKIKNSFKIELSKIQCSKVVAWKSRNSTANITSQQLLNILGQKI